MPLRKMARAVARRTLELKRDFVDRPKGRRVVMEMVHDHPIVVLPGVFNPKVLRTGAVMAGFLTPSLIRGARVLDLGTGSGVSAVFAARWSERVVATDIHPDAVRNAQINVLLHHLEDRVDVRGGDLFVPVRGEKFDVILFNPPYFLGQPRDMSDRAWRATDVLDRFGSELRSHLVEGGSAYVIWSSHAPEEPLRAPLVRHGFAVDVAEVHEVVNEVITIFRVH